ncbi:MAG: RapZ C-terminal domain-containing protein [Pseudonocardiaceae bacterium]
MGGAASTAGLSVCSAIRRRSPIAPGGRVMSRTNKETCAVSLATEVDITSFGYLHASPPHADITIDVRQHLRDPHIHPSFRELNGFDARVHGRVMSTPGASDLIEGVTRTVLALLPGARRGGRSVTVAFGCAGGRHRSVVLANVLAKRLATAGCQAKTEHLHVSEPVVVRS